MEYDMAGEREYWIKGKYGSTDLRVFLECITAVACLVHKGFHSLLVIGSDPTKERSSHACVIQNLFDLLRLAINVASESTQSSSLWLPESPSWMTSAGLFHVF